MHRGGVFGVADRVQRVAQVPAWRHLFGQVHAGEVAHDTNAHGPGAAGAIAAGSGSELDPVPVCLARRRAGVGIAERAIAQHRQAAAALRSGVGIAVDRKSADRTVDGPVQADVAAATGRSQANGRPSARAAILRLSERRHAERKKD